MQRLFLFSFTILFSTAIYDIHAQNDTIWYDKEWKESSKFHAEYFRPKPKKKKGKYVIKDYYLSGQLQMEGNSIKQDTTIFDGEVIHYFENGQTESTTNYSNGVLNGKATQFYENGLIQRIIPFENGIQNGIYKEFFDNGQLRGTIEFKNDLMDGAYEEFYDNGNKKTVLTHKEGEKNGEYFEFYRDGKLKYSGYYEMGILQGEMKSFNSNGELKTSGSFVNNKKHGVWTVVGYDDTRISRTYDMDILNGEMTYEMEREESSVLEKYQGQGMYENGKLVSWSLYKWNKNEFKPFRVMSIKNGKTLWKNYDIKGNLTSEVSYDENNIEDGNWKFYYPNGKLKHDITFLAEDCYDRIDTDVIEETVIEIEEVDNTNGVPGIPKTYLPYALVSQEHFDLYYRCDASALGDYTYFYDNGKPLLKATFKDGKLVGNITLYNKKNKKTIFKLDDTSKLNSAIKITPIKTELYGDTDYMAVEPDPLEIIIYYEYYYGSTKLKKAIVHPVVKSYISNLPSTSDFYVILKNKLNEESENTFDFDRFESRLHYSLESYKTHNTYEDY